MEESDYALEDFDIGELVLSRNVNRKEPWWPVRLSLTPATCLASTLCEEYVY